MGGMRGGFLELLLSRSLSREVTERIACPVLRVREYEERSSFLASLFKASSGHGA
jgi:hypothetical protein